MAARPGHPLLRAALDAIVFHARTGFIGSTPWDATSSQLLCRLVKADPKLLPPDEGSLVYDAVEHVILDPPSNPSPQQDAGNAVSGTAILKQRDGYKPPAGESYKSLWRTARVWRDEVLAINDAEKQSHMWLPLVDPTMS